MYHKYVVVNKTIQFKDMFAEEIENLLDQGWELHGPMVVDDGCLFQALTKETLDA
ncbi:hypothetical protein VPFG_00043 [Vibrio phage nt-1]|uniref:DUF1737 domain-containing protein n=1 Tax=Vibrio phage nt-1 TaxID=115992 RepID=R9TG33_9CAUD|nr:hypothetical protein VPFG_00043 [Vibrio phage nt-1]AGN30048.1 hypothetical protein VPFG_00043 [Vibrio phage nt-1]